MTGATRSGDAGNAPLNKMIMNETPRNNARIVIRIMRQVSAFVPHFDRTRNVAITARSMAGSSVELQWRGEPLSPGSLLITTKFNKPDSTG